MKLYEWKSNRSLGYSYSKLLCVSVRAINDDEALDLAKIRLD